MKPSIPAFILSIALAVSTAGAADAMKHGSLPRWETSASGPLRPLPEYSAVAATNNIITWGGYTFGCAKNGYNDHIFIEPATNTTELTVCSWVAALDADGAARPPEGTGGPRRASNVVPALYYTPNIERSAPDILDGAWGWGTNAVTVSGSLSNNYGFPEAGTSGGGGGDLVVALDNYSSSSYGDSFGPVTTALRFTVPYETAQGWKGYVLEGQSEPTDPGDVMSREYIICDPATGGNLIMLFHYGTEHGKISTLDPSVTPTYTPFGSTSGTMTVSRVSAEPPFWESVWWNGGVTGTNCFPRGVYTVAWTNLSSDMTLSVGGTNVTLSAPAGVRNVLPGSGTGFTLTGNGTASVGISRMKIEPIYKTAATAVGNSEAAYNRAIVSTNWCFVAHRVHLDSAVHTNKIDIVQQSGAHASWGASPELPPDGCGSLRTNGLYQLVYMAFGDMVATYIYEWDRRFYSRWLSDAEIEAVYEDGMRVRTAFGYPSCMVTNAIYPPGASGLQATPALSGAGRNWYASALLATNPPLPETDVTVYVDGLAIPEGLRSTLRSADEIFVAEEKVLEALVARFRDGLAPKNLPVYVEHDRARPCGRVTELWRVPGEGVWVRMQLDGDAAGDGTYLSPELVTAHAVSPDGIHVVIPWKITGMAITADPALDGTFFAPSPGRPYPRKSDE